MVYGSSVQELRIVPSVDAPRHAHVCDSDAFLGRYEVYNLNHGHDGLKHYDLYFCPRQLIGGPTVVARWSSTPRDYASGLSFALAYLKNPKNCVLPNGEEFPWADNTRALGEALRRAVQRGLYNSSGQIPIESLTSPR